MTRYKIDDPVAVGAADGPRGLIEEVDEGETTAYRVAYRVGRDHQVVWAREADLWPAPIEPIEPED